MMSRFLYIKEVEKEKREAITFFYDKKFFGSEEPPPLACLHPSLKLPLNYSVQSNFIALKRIVNRVGKGKRF
jgi:hypothetical protein